MYGPYLGHIGYMGLKAVVVTTLHLTPPSNSRWMRILFIRDIEFEKMKMMLILCLSLGEEICHLKFKRYILEITISCKEHINTNMLG
jgi:hypothetical protein